MGLVDSGHAVRVVTPHVANTPAGLIDDGGVEVDRVRYAPDSLETVAYQADVSVRGLLSPAKLLALPSFLLNFRRAAARALEEFRPDVIHAHWWFPGGWVASGLGIPFVTTSHGSDVRLLEKNRLFKGMGRRVFRKASEATAVSRFLADDIRRIVGVDRVDVTYMPFAMDGLRAAQTRLRSKQRVLFAGNMVATKGVDVLVDAAAQLRDEGVDFELRLIGEGSELGNLKDLAKQRSLENISWSGFVPHSRLIEEYAESSVVVLPSRGKAEGLGLVLAEALVAGCAVVGTTVGGIPEVIEHEKTGLLVEDGNPRLLAGALRRILNDDELRERLVSVGAERIEERHSVAGATAVVEDVLKRAATP